MTQEPFKTLACILSPRYREEGPPAYIEKLFSEEFLGEDGKVREPMRTVLDLIVFGYRPVTSLCILAILVRDGNRPQVGRQLGLQLEKQLGLEDGKLTTGRYYDDRIGRLLKILAQLGILEVGEKPGVMRTKDAYRINASIYPLIEEKIRLFLDGGTLSPFAKSPMDREKKLNQPIKQCSECKRMSTSPEATHCERCGGLLMVKCSYCGRQHPSYYLFCNYSGSALDKGHAKPLDLVATGYTYLDKLLYGGILSCSSVVLASTSCNERDSLIKSFLETGAEKGEVTFYLTTSSRAAKTLSEFRSNSYVFVCNPQASAVDESSPNIFKLKGVENLTEISIGLTTVTRKVDPSLKGQRRACIEIVSDVLLQHGAVQTRKWLTALTTELTSAGFTILAVVDSQMHPPEDLHAILGLFDGEIGIYEKGTEKFLRVKRMTDQEYMEGESPLKKEGSQK